MKPTNFLILHFLIIVLTLLVLQIASAQSSGTWINATSNSTWGTASNWAGTTIASGVDATADFSTLDITAARTVNLGANWTIGALIVGDATTASSNWTLANGTGGPWSLTLGGTAPVINIVNQTTTISATLAGTQGFTKSGTGTLTLTGANTLTGGINLSAGVLNFNSSSLGANLIDITANATLGWNGTNTLDVSPQLKIEDGVVATLAIGANNVTLATPIQLGGAGTASITKTGAGTLTFTAVNTYTGTTKINAGRIVLSGGNDRLATTGSLNLGQGAGSGTLQLGDAAGAVNQTFKSLATTGTGTANAIVGGNAANAVLTVNNSTAVTYAGMLGGSGTNENNLSLVKTGSAALTLSNAASSFTGNVSVTGGALIVKNPSALGSGTKTITVAGATNTPSLQLDGAAGEIVLASGLSLITSNQSAASPAILNTAGNNIINGTLSPTNGGTGAGSTRIKVNAGSLTLNGNIAPATSATSARTLILDGASDGTVNGVIANNAVALALTKDGAGTWTLTSANTFSGAVSVLNGALVVTNTSGSGTGTGAVSVSSGAALGGTGFISGATTLQSGSLLEPGTSTITGTLTFSNKLTLLDGSMTEFHLSSSTLYDKVAATQLAVGLSSNSSAAFRVLFDNGFSPSAGDVFKLLDWTTLLPGDSDLADNLDLSFAALGSGLQWDTSSFHSTGTLAVIVPEPGRALLLALGTTSLVIRRRRDART